jgi:hypothetical protein
VLKGGVLLAAFDARRPTRDIDLAASALRNTEGEILAVVREIAGISLDDGIEFDSERAVAEVIREEHEYSGVRGCVATRWKWCLPRKSQQRLPEAPPTRDGATLSTCIY